MKRYVIRNVLVFGILLIIGLLINSCNNEKNSMSNSLEDIRAVFKQDKTLIIEKYNATGAGIGKDGKHYVIVVYLKKRVSANETILLFWKGIPIKLEFIGEIKPL
tara:strand:+ start:13318 stop:13632 length:315 start_codon:yes stop_codon:yes gene_type:complete